MNQDQLSEARGMLCLAALSYRAFEGPLAGPVHIDRLRLALDRGFTELAPTCGAWHRVWGPVVYRAPFSLFDDELMYVVRAGQEHRYAVVIRGTNPVSLFDWLFGDLWVTVQVPWPYGDPASARDAKISLSTLLGLNMLQIMQSPVEADGLIDIVRRRIGDSMSAVLDHVGDLLRPLTGAATADLRTLRDGVVPILTQLDTVRRARPQRDETARVLGLLDDWRSTARTQVLGRTTEAIRLVAQHGSFNALRFLAGGAKLRAALEDGVTLQAFLSAAVEHAGGKPVDVVVTGHSKGGALSSTLALFLADTQGIAHVDESLRWDPHDKATVRCFSFAGPTAGNAAFRDHSDRVIGPRCHRVVNPLDVVPHAWDTNDLTAISSLYTKAAPIPPLRDLVDVIAGDVKELGYTHVGQHVVKLPGKENPLLPDFFLQFVHQHMAGYLEGLDLTGKVSNLTFFGPINLGARH